MVTRKKRINLWATKKIKKPTVVRFRRSDGAIVLKAVEKNKGLLCLIHCTCGNYHITFNKSEESIEILDTAKNKKDGEKLYEKIKKKLV